MNDTQPHLADNFVDLLSGLRELEKRCDALSRAHPGRLLWQHFQMIRKELEALNALWLRFLATRFALIAINVEARQPGGSAEPTPEVLASVFAREEPLIADVTVDLKSLFLFADILLNKLVLLLGAIEGRNRGIQYRSFSAWLRSAQVAASRGEHCSDASLYKLATEPLERLEVLLGFFRDKFIVHWIGPYTEMLSRGVFHPVINLEIQSWQLGKFSHESFLELLDAFGPLGPTIDVFGRPIRQPGDIRPKVEALFYHLHLVRDSGLRERAEGFIRKVGMRAPDIYYLIGYLRTAVTTVFNALPLSGQGI